MSRRERGLIAAGGGLARAAGLAFLLVSTGCGPNASDPPTVESNPDALFTETVTAEGVLHVQSDGPREWLAVEEADRAPTGTAILFWDYQAAALDPSGRAYIADPDGDRILVLDGKLRPIAWRRPSGRRGERLARPVLVSAWGNDTLVAFEASGDIVVFDLWGRTFERLDGPFPVHVGAVAPGHRLVLARSPVLFPFDLVAPGDPLLAMLDLPQGRTTGVDSVVPPPPGYWYAGIAANAGMLTVESSGAFYFAWLTRPEIRKYDVGGRLVWRSERRIPFAVDVPRLVPQAAGERPRLRLHTVHKGIALGPDELLYARAAADTLGRGDRLEVFDPATGAWLRSAALDTGSVVLVGARGRIWEMAPSRFLPATEPERRRLPAYALATIGGDTLGPSDARGRVLVIAVWATWCTPCREELPLLDTLYRKTSRNALEVHAISEDLSAEDARRFAQSLGLSFPLLLGRGQMRERFGYQGLPFTLIVDRRGRVARQLYGFGGRDEFVNRVLPLIRQEMESASP